MVLLLQSMWLLQLKHHHDVFPLLAIFFLRSSLRRKPESSTLTNIKLGFAACAGMMSKDKELDSGFRRNDELEKTSTSEEVRKRAKKIRYCIECNPIMLPSVSYTSAIAPYCPIDVLAKWSLPPFFTARSASTAQSSQPK